MKNKLLAMIMVGAIFVSTAATPALAADDTPLGSVASLFGSITAILVDVPQGVLYHSLYNCPLKTTQYLAESFGDSGGLGQNLAGAALGIPAGMLWGIPYGAITGGLHGMNTGWEEPFSTSSYIVIEEN